MKTAQRKNRWTRAGAGALLCLLLTLPLTVGTGVAPASARPVASGATGDPVDQCTPARGALVAVDFGPFGGPVRRGCDLTPETGYQLLKDTGFRTEGTEHDGPAFICRIGHPTVHSGTPYPTPRDEECRLTPPTTAYWSYWVAAPGQTRWTYSTLGAMGRRLSPGDVDAWVFGGTQAGGTDGGPAFTPDDVRQGFVDERAAGNWLADHLKGRDHVVRDGEPDPLQTAETAFALAATGGHTGTLDRLTAYLRRTVTAFAYPNGTREAPEPKAAARLALLARINHDAPRDFGGRDLIGDLLRHVCTEGSGTNGPSGCTAPGDFRHAAGTEAQALSLLALLRVGAAPPAATVTRLLSTQCRDGGFTSLLIVPGESCDSEPAATALATLVLRQTGGHDEAVTRAVGHLRERQGEDGSFTLPGLPGGLVHETGYAVQALRAAGDSTRARKALVWLARQQREDGAFGFGDSMTDPLVPTTVTAALAAAGTSLVTLTAPAKPVGKAPDLKKGGDYLTGRSRLLKGAYYGVPGTDRADYGLTVDGAYALIATGDHRAELKAMVDFLDGGGRDGEGRTVHAWTGVGTRHAAGGPMGKTALLAQATGRDPRDFGGRDLIGGLARAVCPARDKSTGCEAEGAYTHTHSVFGQALGIMAQLRVGEHRSAAAPVDYLLDLQQPSGAWTGVIPTGGPDEVDSTAIAAMALDRVDDPRARAAVDRALAWIASRQLADGGFTGAAGTSVNSTALAVQGFSLDAKTYADRLGRARAFLAGQQNADGGFNTAKEDRGSDLRASTQAVGGTTGISFALLDRRLPARPPVTTPPGTNPPPPDIVTPDYPGGDGPGTGGRDGHGNGNGAGGDGGPGGTDGGHAPQGGHLARTGTSADTLLPVAALLATAGAALVTAVGVLRLRGRRTTGTRADGGSRA
ncbi:prenyltransferase/squalene oxidase repeat-containing protein [Streptomyces clavuligerus]|uniref:prenyltransferase/squalene oxidase repeat-containing protein n=1 Tax=Streptomyces clavuligerus TaxID=1901 RepID=UPI00099F7A47|nr:prenyltransferase/squalene oxidase repeat-containing protein [Streptomyces clavuligerus]